MMYYLIINGAQSGPFTLETVQAMRASTEIGPDTLIWKEGQSDWQPLAQVLGPVTLRQLPVPPPFATLPRPTVKRSFLGGMGLPLVVAGALFLGMVLTVGSLAGYMVYIGNGYDKSSKAYVDEAVPAIVTTWSQEELEKRESRAFQKATPKEQLTKIFAYFRRLGELKSYDGSKGDAHMNFTSQDGRVVSAAYLAWATFQNGKAEINVTLVMVNGVWKIHGFRINSPLFLK